MQDAFIRRLTQVLRSPAAEATQRLQAALCNLHQLQRLLAPFGPPHAPPEQQLLSDIDVALLGDLLHYLSEELLRSQQPQQQEQKAQQQQQQPPGGNRDSPTGDEQGQLSDERQQQQMKMEQLAPGQLDKQRQGSSGEPPSSSVAPHLNGQHGAPGAEIATMDVDE